MFREDNFSFIEFTLLSASISVKYKLYQVFTVGPIIGTLSSLRLILPTRLDAASPLQHEMHDASKQYQTLHSGRTRRFRPVLCPSRGYLKKHRVCALAPCRSQSAVSESRWPVRKGHSDSMNREPNNQVYQRRWDHR